MSTPRLDLAELIANQSQPHVPHNAALRRLDVLVQSVVLDKDLTAPPGSMQDGDAYIVAPGATGAWMTHDYAIAYWWEQWYFIVPGNGWRVHVADEGIDYRYDDADSPAGWGIAVDVAIPSGLEYSDEEAREAVATALTDSDTIEWESSTGFDMITARVKRALVIVDVPGTNRTLSQADAYKYLRATNAGGLTLTIPAAPHDIEDGAVFVLRQTQAGQIESVPETGVTADPPDAQTAFTRAIGSSMTLIYVGGDEWDLSGDLEAAP